MPLKPGSSRKVISENIHELTHHGSRPRSHDQIVAIALHNADEHPRHRGGIVRRDDGGGITAGQDSPRDYEIAALQNLTGDDRAGYQEASKYADLANYTPLGIPQALYDAGQWMGRGAQNVASGNPGIGSLQAAGGLGLAAVSAVPGLRGEARAVEDVAPSFTAYHGSPYDFDRFDPAKIGTGEGAQSYGHGLYFAQNENVARSYRDDIADMKGDKVFVADQPYDPTNLDHVAARTVDDLGRGDPKKAISSLKISMRNRPGPGGSWAGYQGVTGVNDPQAVIDRIQAGNLPEVTRIPTKGRMYQVNVAADPGHFIDWDKPVHAQDPWVLDRLQRAGMKANPPPDISSIKDPQIRSIVGAALKKNDGQFQGLGLTIDNDRKLYDAAVAHAKKNGVDLLDETGSYASRGGYFPSDYVFDQAKKFVSKLQASEANTVQDAYKTMAAKSSPAEASAKLQKAGLKGFKYLDQGSRDTNDGTRNYVVFDPNDVNIARKYRRGGGLALKKRDDGGSITPLASSPRDYEIAFLQNMTGDDRAGYEDAEKYADLANVSPLGIPEQLYDAGQWMGHGIRDFARGEPLKGTAKIVGGGGLAAVTSLSPGAEEVAAGLMGKKAAEDAHLRVATSWIPVDAVQSLGDSKEWISRGISDIKAGRRAAGISKIGAGIGTAETVASEPEESGGPAPAHYDNSDARVLQMLRDSVGKPPPTKQHPEPPLPPLPNWDRTMPSSPPRNWEQQPQRDEGRTVIVKAGLNRGGIVPHRQGGGGLGPPITQSPAASLNPFQQGALRQFGGLTDEKLQELVQRLGDSPQGMLANRLLQARRLGQAPQPQQQPQAGVSAPPSAPMSPMPAQPQQGQMRRGGGLRRDIGGGISLGEGSPWWTRAEERGESGFLNGSTLGRADHLMATAPSGSYIVPADVVAGLGEGNSLAGAKVMDEMLNSGPWGTRLPRLAHREPPEARAPGGIRLPRQPVYEQHGGPVRGHGQEEERVPVALSHGEYQIDPEDVRRIGGGNIKLGHARLDHWVVRMRGEQIDKLKGLKPPVGSDVKTKKAA